MKAFFKVILATLVLSVASITHVSATPLSMEYTITDIGGGTYQYDFQITVDNNDGSWTAGDNFNWFIFGDCGITCTSPLTDWTGLSSSESSFNFSVSSGGHNGPTLIDNSDIFGGGWYTNAIGDTLSFSGTSTAYLGAGTLFWSNIMKGIGDTSTLANMELGTLVDSFNSPANVPEAPTLFMLGLGLLGIGFTRNKKA